MTDSDRYQRALEIFLAAVEVEGAERERILDDRCGDDELRAEVERALALADADAVATGSFLERPAAETAATDPIPVRVGGYTISSLLGRGGMGDVYAARQTSPFERDVAIKIIRGADPEVIERFEAEQQALAMMDHPNIATVHDAGVTDDGQPYFVMELVRGDPLLDFAAAHRLTLSARLDVFRQVCHAVQHAHQKGIIHRDLKPSNIVVALHDGVPVPKVIDFGIAKAIDPDATTRKFRTADRQLVGTPVYMSPEQAALTERDVDTRSDIYSLGVILYEMLTGTPPFEAGALRDAGIGEMLRVIREDTPPKPSTRLLSLDDDATKLAEQYGLRDASRLTQQLRGDLDWVVMRCMEKERERRYASATELAEELRRFQRMEPVVAGPPSKAYRLRKFVRRNRIAVAAAMGVIFFMALAAVGTSVGMIIAFQQARLAKEATIRESEAKQVALDEAENARVALGFFRNRLIELNPLHGSELGAARPEGPWSETSLVEFLRVCADSIDEELVEHPHIRSTVKSIVGSSLFALGDVERGRGELAELRGGWVEGPPEAIDAIMWSGLSLLTLAPPPAELELAIERLEDVIPTLESQSERGDEQFLLARVTLNLLQGILGARRRDMTLLSTSFDEAEAIHAEAVARLGPGHPVALLSEVRRLSARAANRFGPVPRDDIESLVARSHASLGPDNLIELIALSQLVSAYTARRQRAAEIEASERLIGVVLRLLGPRHQMAAPFLRGHVAMLRHHQEFAIAEAFLREHPDVVSSLVSPSPEAEMFLHSLMGRGCEDRGDTRQAVVHYQIAAAVLTRTELTHAMLITEAVWLFEALARLDDDKAPEWEAQAEQWRQKLKRSP